MEKMTVTEALAEVKLVLKKIEKKKQTVAQNLVRIEHDKDPFGDTKLMVKSEIQSVQDLYKRLVSIRKAISKSNLETIVAIGNLTLSVTEWLTWKKEVYKPLNELYASTVSRSTELLKNASDRPQLYKKEPQDEAQLVKVVSNVDVAQLTKYQEEILEVNEKLDGLLSLKNATVMLEF